MKTVAVVSGQLRSEREGGWAESEQTLYVLIG